MHASFYTLRRRHEWYVDVVGVCLVGVGTFLALSNIKRGTEKKWKSPI